MRAKSSLIWLRRCVFQSQGLFGAWWAVEPRRGHYAPYFLNRRGLYQRVYSENQPGVTAFDLGKPLESRPLRPGWPGLLAPTASEGRAIGRFVQESVLQISVDSTGRDCLKEGLDALLG